MKEWKFNLKNIYSGYRFFKDQEKNRRFIFSCAVSEVGRAPSRAALPDHWPVLRENCTDKYCTRRLKRCYIANKWDLDFLKIMEMKIFLPKISDRFRLIQFVWQTVKVHLLLKYRFFAINWYLRWIILVNFRFIRVFLLLFIFRNWIIRRNWFLNLNIG